MARLDAVARSEPANAIAGWSLTAVVALAGVESALTNDPLWGGLAFLVVAVAAIPALRTGDWTTIVPWPLLLTAAGAVLVRATGRYPEAAGYVCVATLAVVAVVELDAFTPVEMSRRFAVAFAGLTTLAVQALWTIVQYYSDLWLGTEYLGSQRELQLDIVVVAGVALVVSAGFQWYFGRVAHVGSHARPIGGSVDNDDR